MMDIETKNQFRLTNAPVSVTISLIMTSLAYYAFKQKNIRIKEYFIIPTLLAFIPIKIFNDALFVNKKEMEKFRKMTLNN